MTKEMVTATEPVGLEEANAILKSSKKGKLPVINAEGKVRLTFVCKTGRGIRLPPAGYKVTA